MMLVLPDVLDAQAVLEMRRLLEGASWQDGRETAGYLAAQHKRNQQLPVQDELAMRLGERVLHALSGHARFLSFALPLSILPPMFNRYCDGGEYGFHVDNAIRVDPRSGQRIRTDVSTTLFLSDPQDYDGGELVIQDSYGVRQVKLPAGYAVVYPGTSLHRVAPVTRGQRLAAFFWSQSMVPDTERRTTLFEMDTAIQALAVRHENAEQVLALTGIYHNLVRQWSQI